MSRFLFVCPQFAGHVNPAVSVAMELAARGHEVEWAAPRRIRSLLPPHAVMHPFDDELVEELRAAFIGRVGAGGGLANDVRAFWEELVLPLARGTLADVERAVDAFRPDVLAVDQHALAGALAARRRGVPWATLAPTALVTTDEALARLPLVREWLAAHLAELQRWAGLDPVPLPDRSPALVIGFSLPDLAGREVAVPAHYRFVGPAIEHRAGLEAGAPPDLAGDEDGRPRVLVSLGSVNTYRQRRFFETVFATLSDLPVRSIVVAPPEQLPEPHENVLVLRPYVNNLALLPHADAVLCHGGHGTVYEALAHGVPVVAAPVTFDQPLVADQLVASGAGIRVRSARATPGELRRAIEAVLAEPSYREAAARVRERLLAAGGARAAADELERLS